MSMTPPVDPNAVLMTGENSFIRLSRDGGASLTDRLSHWRVLWCPAGAGHALFVQSELTDGRVIIYSDNEAVARWLQTTIETLLFPDFADPAAAITAAVFTREGTPHVSATERVEAADGAWRLTWSDFVEPFVLTLPPGFNGRPLGVFSTFFPARSARVEFGGRVATGQPWSEMRGDRPSSSACLALSETWVAPRG
jgi:hypothetical protein